MKIDHIYCINLERSVERRAKMEIEFKKADIEVEIFKACDAKAIGRTGTYGCNQTHLWIYQDILEKGYKNALIFEDDVILNSEFKKQIEELEEPSEWDLLYFSRIAPIVLDKPSKSFTLGKCLSTAAYIVSAGAANKLAHFSPDDLNYEIDNFLTVVPLKTYISNDKTIAYSDMPYVGEIGFGIERFHKEWLIYFARYVDAKFGGLIALMLLSFLVKFLIRKWTGI